MRAALPIFALVALAMPDPAAMAQRVVERPAPPVGVGGAVGGAGAGATVQPGGLNGTMRTSMPSLDTAGSHGCCATGRPGENGGPAGTPDAGDTAADHAADRVLDGLIARLPLVGKAQRHD